MLVSEIGNAVCLQKMEGKQAGGHSLAKLFYKEEIGMDFLNEFMMPVILGICLCAGFVVKKWVKDVDNKYIPTMVAVLGIFLAVWINGWTLRPETVLRGMISGLSSTGLHQLFAQYINRND